MADEVMLKTCPYNAYHKIRPMRMQTHLLKCRKGYPNQGQSRCKYNQYHVVHDMELEYHEGQCADKDNPEHGFNALKHKIPEFRKHEELEGGEDWDEDLKKREKDFAGMSPFMYPRLRSETFTMYTKKNMTRTEKKIWSEQQSVSFKEHGSKRATQWVTEPPLEDVPDE